MYTVLNILIALLAADLVAVLILSVCIRSAKKKLRDQRKRPDMIPVTVSEKDAEGPWKWQNAADAVPDYPAEGKAHEIGARKEQQDCHGSAAIFRRHGSLTVVADGMGGLTGGQQVSQRIVMGMLSMAPQVRRESLDSALMNMVKHVTQDVNQMLGPEGLYKSGSTLLAVLTYKDKFHWISVGDSRIYLFRNGAMLQLNQEHTLFQEWLPEILAGKRSYAEARSNPEGRKLTSFIGMGKLKYVDFSKQAIKILPGDRILLMSDGVFNTLSDQQMAKILTQNTDVRKAAAVMDQMIRAAKIPAQDNYTVRILGF